MDREQCLYRCLDNSVAGLQTESLFIVELSDPTADTVFIDQTPDSTVFMGELPDFNQREENIRKGGSG